MWTPSGAKYQAFKEAPYKDEFDEWLARIVCYAFSLPATAFTRQVNRATAETAQDAALDEGLAPLMGWVKRLADHVIQDRMGQPDLEFAWVDQRPADPAAQAKLLDTYVKDGIYTINEARDILGFEPVAGGERPMVYAATGPVPPTAFAPTPAVSNPLLLRGRGEGEGATAERAKRSAVPLPLAKAGFDPDEPRIPGGEPDGGEWTDEGNDRDGSADTGDGTDSSAAGNYGISITIAGDDSGSADESTADSSDSTVAPDDVPERVGAEQTDSSGASDVRNDSTTYLTDVAYQGTYHDRVVAELATRWTSQGATVITSVNLTGRNGITARADLIAIDPIGGGLTLFEVKTGADPQYTDPQRIVYPMAQIGNHVYSSDSKIRQLGFTPGEWLPPMRFFTIYKRDEQSPYLWIEHPNPEVP